MTYNKLREDERRVIEEKATEPAFVGKYDNFYEPGTIFVVNVMPLFSHPRANSMRVVVGQLLTIAFLVR